MRLQFLQCREEWLAEVIQDLEEQNVYDYLKRLTDMHRLHLFDVVMQYRAIFSDDSSMQVLFRKVTSIDCILCRITCAHLWSTMWLLYSQDTVACCVQ